MSMRPQKEQLELTSQFEREDSEFRKFSSSLKMCIAYASNIGGIGTIIGCGPNIVMKGQADLYVLEFTPKFTVKSPQVIAATFAFKTALPWKVQCMACEIAKSFAIIP